MQAFGGLPAGSVVAQLVLLALVDRAAGAGGPGAAVSLACALVGGVLLTRWLVDAGRRRLGPADHVTVTRATLACAVSGLTVESLLGHRNPTGLVLIAAVALALDAVDGWVARRTGTATPLGARMDMEVDAFLILVLSVAATRVLGWWVLAIGAFRYAFLAATWVAPWLGGAVPPRFSRKAVAAIQGVVLTVVAADLLPREDSAAVVVLALGLLVWSFGTQVTELWPHREPRLGRTSARDPVVRALE